MKCFLAVLLCYLSLTAATVHPFNPVFEYDVPVAQPQVVYRQAHGNFGIPAYSAGYNSAYNYGYGYGYAPASQSYSHQTRTYHPVSYYRPAYGAQYAQYYTAAPYSAYSSSTAGTSSNARTIVPLAPRTYRYHSGSQRYSTPVTSYNQQQANYQGQSQQQQNFEGQSQQQQNFQGQSEQQQSFQGQPQRQQNFQGQSQRQQFFQGQPQQQQSFQGQPQRQQFFQGQPQQQQLGAYPDQQNAGRNYANNSPYQNNGEMVPKQRYHVHRPGIKKEYYDIEERIIVRPAGSAIIELDPPTKKEPLRSPPDNYRPNQFNDNAGGQYNQFNGNGAAQSNQYNGNGAANGNNAYRVPDCDFGQTPVYEYGPPVINDQNEIPSGEPNQNTGPVQFHPTTQYVPTYPVYPTTTVVPATTYQPSYPDQTFSTTGSDYPTTTYPSSTYPSTTYPTSTYPSTTTQYPTTTPGSRFHPYPPGVHTTTSGPARNTTLTTKDQSDIFISSTTPLTVTIVERNDKPNKTSDTPYGSSGYNNGYAGKPDIVFASGNDQYSSTDNPNSINNELPPRGDTAQYRASEQPDQFYYELPHGRANSQQRPNSANSNEFARFSNGQSEHGPNVYTKSDGEEWAEGRLDGRDGVVAIGPKMRNSTAGNRRNQTSYGNRQQERYILLETSGGASDSQAELAQVEEFDPRQSGENGRSGKYQADSNESDSQSQEENGQSGQYRADDGQFEGQSGQYQGQSGQYQGQNGQYQEQNGQFQGQSGQYQGENGQYRENSQFSNTNDQYNQGNSQNGQYQDNGSQNFNRNAGKDDQNDGGIRARVVSVTPAPPNAVPTETVNRRRVVVSKPIKTIQLVEEPINVDANNQNSNYNNNNYYKNANGQSNDSGYRGSYNDQRQNANFNQNSNGASAQQANGNGSGSKGATGFYVSTTPSTASQRIIYIQPVTQEFAQQKAITPKVRT